jgi:hypothetical protein
MIFSRTSGLTWKKSEGPDLKRTTEHLLFESRFTSKVLDGT